MKIENGIWEVQKNLFLLDAFRYQHSSKKECCVSPCALKGKIGRSLYLISIIHATSAINFPRTLMVGMEWLVTILDLFKKNFLTKKISDRQKTKRQPTGENEKKIQKDV